MHVLSYAFYLAGLINIGGMLFLALSDLSNLFTAYSSIVLGGGSPGLVLTSQAATLVSLYPTVFSAEGCFAVILWGLAYIAVAHCFRAVPLLCLVFCLEKVFYTFTWFYWNQNNSAQAVMKQNPLLGLFFEMYGYNDAFFAIIFALAFIVAVTSRPCGGKGKRKKL